ncbi:hypothetical protein DMENIID0001_159740 [Sergentomyia squamirostris]
MEKFPQSDFPSFQTSVIAQEVVQARGEMGTTKCEFIEEKVVNRMEKNSHSQFGYSNQKTEQIQTVELDGDVVKCGKEKDREEDTGNSSDGKLNYVIPFVMYPKSTITTPSFETISVVLFLCPSICGDNKGWCRYARIFSSTTSVPKMVKSPKNFYTHIVPPDTECPPLYGSTVCMDAYSSSLNLKYNTTRWVGGRLNWSVCNAEEQVTGIYVSNACSEEF